MPEIAGPTHRYLEASPGCWKLYGEVLSLEYGDRTYWGSHRLTVDTYAVQHPGRPSAQSVRSVAIHLISLCLVLERDATPEYALRVIRAATAASEGLRWLDPPSSLGETTVADVHGAADAADHGRRVRMWADAAWSAWAAHHRTIRAWIPKGV